MRRKMIKTAMTGLGILMGLTLVTSAMATPAFAEVNINVNIGAPPAVIVHERPTMVYLPEPGMYVAIGVPYDIFFVSGRYYYFHGDNWFWAGGYGGPWVHVVSRSLPPGLQKYKVVQLRDFREREYRVYKTQGPKFAGKHFDADPGPHGPPSSHGNGNSGNGNGNGNQNGNGNGNGNSGSGKSGGQGKGRN